MTTLGKVLTFLNLLGAAGFVCLAIMVIGKHQAWKYANFRYDLLANGLPLNTEERDKQWNQPLAEVIGDPKEPKQTLKELFPQNPVNTQILEVERVYQVLNGELAKVQADRNKHLATLATNLKPLATDFAERQRLVLIRINLADDDKAKALKAALQQGVRPALVRMKQDEKEYAGKAERVGERRQRPFEQAYREGVQAQGGVPRDPFVEKLLAVVPRQGGKKFAEAAAALGEPPSEEAFLRAVRNEPTKTFPEIFDAAYDEMLGRLDVELKQRLDDHVQEALTGLRRKITDTGTSATAKMAPPDQKKAIARLLFNLVEVLPRPAAPQQGRFWDDPGYKRVINVVGLRALAHEIERQAQLYQKMQNDLLASIAREHNDFTVVHQDLLEQIKDRAGQVALISALIQKTKDLADDKEKIVARRKVDVDTYHTELDKVRKDANAHLETLRQMSAELFKVQVQKRDATRMNQEYERQINAIEDRVR